MALFPEELRARPDREIPPTWERMQNWVDRFPARHSGTVIRTTELPDETLVFAAPSANPWDHPFFVSLFGFEAVLSPGLLNLEMPRMGTENLTLDGKDENGEDAGKVPTLELLGQRYGGGGADNRSFICLRVMCDLETGEPDVEGRPLEYLTVVHRPELPPGFHSGGMPEILEDGATVGLWPLAVCYWSEDSSQLLRVVQNCHHNQQHRYQRGESSDEDPESTRPGRHWFFGAN